MSIELKIICDSREKLNNNANEKAYSDHFSKKSIDDIVDIINSLGYNCHHFGGIYDLLELCNRDISLPNDYFINISDGLFQKNKRLQAPVLLELLDTNYSGSEPFAVALANNKYISKKIVNIETKICVPNDYLVVNGQVNKLNTFNYPIIIKPNDEGSSIGISKDSLIENEIDALKYLSSFTKEFNNALIEEYVSGYEVTSLIIGNEKNEKVYPLLIKVDDTAYFDNLIMDKQIKMQHKRTYVNPNEYLSAKCITKIISATQSIKKCIGLSDIARVDFRIKKDETIYFIEVNSNPVLSKSSEIGEIEKIYNINTSELINSYIKAFINRVQN